MKNNMLCVAATLAFAANPLSINSAQADEHIHNHNAAPAPIGVMGDHVHEEGSLMFSYRYSNMKMAGNRSGTDSLTPAQTRAAGFMVAPLNMTMQMHMFGAMYGASEDLTLTAMLPYVHKSMNHETGGGMRFETSSEGLGDAKLGGIYNLYNNHNENLNLSFGVAIPTGSVDERDNTPAMANAKLPYPMQLGSGTFDPMLGITYTNSLQDFSYGVQAGTTQRLGKNSEGYRLGDEYNLTGWVATEINDVFGASLRLDGKKWGDISGSDSQLNPAMVPTARPDLRAGRRVDALIGLDIQPFDDKLLNGHRLALEFGVPLYQHLDGPQLESDYRLTLGWQYSF